MDQIEFFKLNAKTNVVAFASGDDVEKNLYPIDLIHAYQHSKLIQTLFENDKDGFKKLEIIPVFSSRKYDNHLGNALFKITLFLSGMITVEQILVEEEKIEDLEKFHNTLALYTVINYFDVSPQKLEKFFTTAYAFLLKYIPNSIHLAMRSKYEGKGHQTLKKIQTFINAIPPCHVTIVNLQEKISLMDSLISFTPEFSVSSVHRDQQTLFLTQKNGSQLIFEPERVYEFSDNDCFNSYRKKSILTLAPIGTLKPSAINGKVCTGSNIENYKNPLLKSVEIYNKYTWASGEVGTISFKIDMATFLPNYETIFGDPFNEKQFITLVLATLLNYTHCKWINN
jgi:hypothetical protein